MKVQRRGTAVRFPFPHPAPCLPAQALSVRTSTCTPLLFSFPPTSTTGTMCAATRQHGSKVARPAP